MQTHRNSPQQYVSPDEVPLIGIVRPGLWALVVEQERAGRLHIKQINYAICVLRALREGIRCKEIWIEGPTAIVILLRMSHRTLPRTGCAPIRHAINLSRARRLFLASSTPYRVDLENAIRHTGQIVADFLDTVSFMKRVPISIRHIEVHAAGKKYLQLFVTLPYGPRQLTVDDLTKATTVPPRLKAALRLFREGLNARSPHYRLLGLYRVREVIEKVRRENDQDVLAHGMKPHRPRQSLPDNELTRRHFPTYVGKKIGDFLDHVRSAYRLAVAHGNLDEYFKLVLDPNIVSVDHRLDFTNAVLMPVIAEMIQDEMDFMIRQGLSGS